MDELVNSFYSVAMLSVEMLTAKAPNRILGGRISKAKVRELVEETFVGFKPGFHPTREAEIALGIERNRRAICLAALSQEDQTSCAESCLTFPQHIGTNRKRVKGEL